MLGVLICLEHAPTDNYSSEPELGEHTELVFEQLVYDCDAIADLKQ